MRFKGYPVVHTIDAKLKHCYIRVSPYGEILIKSPGLPQSDLEALLEKKAKKLLPLLEKPSRKRPRLGSEMELFGKTLPLDDTLQEMLGRLRNKDEASMRRTYDRYYTMRAKSYIASRCVYIQEVTGIFAKSLRFRKMRRRWGSCTKDGVVTFNIHLIKEPKAFIDEVIVHELSHLVFFDHSRGFYDFMHANLRRIGL